MDVEKVSIVKPNEAVAVAIEAEGNGYRERTFAECANNPLGRLVMGVLRGKIGGKYIVGLLNNWYQIKGTATLTEAALAIPVETRIKNRIGKIVTIYGAVPWDTNFEAERIKVYTDFGVKKVPKTGIRRIKSWH